MMIPKKPLEKASLVQGTLNLLILEVLREAAGHGYDVIERIRRRSRDVFLVEEGSLYPALHRMEKDGWLTSEWRPSEANRRAKYYRLTAKGQKQLAREVEHWETVSLAIGHVLGTTFAKVQPA